MFMSACFTPRNSKFGIFRGLGLLRRWINAKDCAFFCNTYSRVSAAPLLDDSDYCSSSSCESQSENEGNITEVRDNIRSIKLFCSVVRVIKSLNWEVARKISFATGVEKYGLDQSFVAFKMLVHVYASSGMQMEVFALLREIVCYYRKAELSLFGLLCALLDGSCDGEGLSFVVNVAIKVFASNMLLENAVNAFAHARTIGLQPGIRSCNFLLKCLVEANSREFVVTLFEEMKKYGPWPSVYTYTIMMNFYCHGYGTVNIEQATDILEEMEAIGIRPSSVTYSTYIRGLCKVGAVELALNVIQELRRNALPLNSYCYNAVIHEFVSRDIPDEALQVFNEMKNCGIAPDVYSYSILIEGFCRSGDVGKGLSLFEEMRITDIKPSIVTYSSILKGLIRAGLMEDSLDLFQKIRTFGCKYDQHAYNILITGFCMQGDMDSAGKLLEEMVNNKLAPSFKKVHFPVVIRATML